MQKCKSAILFELGIMNHEKGWTQQFHYGALRNNNSLMLNRTGPDTGFDSIGDEPVARSMSLFLDHLAAREKLTKTIIYNLNPKDNELVASMTGNFQDGSIPGKIQFGSGWWFLDQKHGIENQLNSLSNMGLLSRFAGMVTDSRSFLSYPRHEYFRRILCNLIGEDVEKGELPGDLEVLGKMVQDISYYNARNYFNF
ncbi:MAG: glucuronate isomerase [Bacteroidetes bacterium]|nr:glucuronate isomerase [Bacteroidota bacterium]